MSTEENYLDSLLKSISEPRGEKSTDEGEADGEIALDALEMPESEPEVELSDNELSDIELHEVEASAVEIPTAVSGGMGGMEGKLSQDEISDLLSQVLTDDNDEENGSVSDVAADIADTPETIADDIGTIGDISIDGLDEAIQSATETEIAGELDADELSIDEPEQEIAADDGKSDIDVAETSEEELNIDDVSFDDLKNDDNADMTSNVGGLDDGFSLDDILDPVLNEDTSDVTDVSDVSAADAEEDDDDFSVDIPDIETLDVTDSFQTGGAEAEIDENELLSVDEGNVADSMDDVLSLLDEETDSDLAEIHDMLKKDDNNEPIQDDMMDMLSQMAENEKAFVDAGKMEDMDDSDEGAPKPNIDVVKRVENKKAEMEETEKAKPKKEKAKKKKASKKKGDNEEDTDELAAVEKDAPKKPGAMSKFFNMLTEDLVPEPTEEELEAEKAAKEAKKQENLTKKEEEKAAKEEAKKAKAEEKEAAKKAKAAEAEQKKKEKKAAKEAKLEAKRAKEASKPPIKRIPPKKLMAGALFGATVFGAIMVATSILASQGYIQKARKAYYNGDYMTAYRATYGMELDSSDDIIKGRSEAILKMERKYDSYKNNMKMGREIEALNALISSYETYDYINTDAEQYGVLAEVDAIKDEISNILLTDYGIDETAARELLQIEDSLSYSMALNDIINGKQQP